MVDYKKKEKLKKKQKWSFSAEEMSIIVWHGKMDIVSRNVGLLAVFVKYHTI